MAKFITGRREYYAKQQYMGILLSVSGNTSIRMFLAHISVLIIVSRESLYPMSVNHNTNVNANILLVFKNE